MAGELESKAPEEGAGIHKDYNDKFVVGHALVAIFICSVIIMSSILNISFDSGCWGSKTKWLFACATISAIVCAAWLAIFKFQEDLSQKLAPFVCVFLSLWWFIGVFTGTNWEPFFTTGLGYFACWLALYVACHTSYQVVTQFKDAVDKVKDMVGATQPLAVLLVCSIMELTAASILCHSCTGKVAYAVSVGAIGLLMCIGLIAYLKFQGKPSEGVWKVITIIQALWWFVAACYLTFKVFPITGNGYFSLWVGACVACYMAAEAFGKAPAVSAESSKSAATEAMTKAMSLDLPVLIAVVLVCGVIIVIDLLTWSERVGDYPSKYMWQFCCAIISSIACGVWLLLWKFVTDLATKSGPIFGGILAIWWFFGVFICTNWLPYPWTGNGYIMDWVAFIASFKAAYMSLSQFREMADKVTSQSGNMAWLTILLICSIIEITCASIQCDAMNTWSNCSGKIAYAVALGVISLLVVIGLIVWIQVIQGSVEEMPWKILTGVLCLWWIIGACILTFAGASSLNSGLVLVVSPATSPATGYSGGYHRHHRHSSTGSGSCPHTCNCDFLTLEDGSYGVCITKSGCSNKETNTARKCTEACVNGGQQECCWKTSVQGYKDGGTCTLVSAGSTHRHHRHHRHSNTCSGSEATGSSIAYSREQGYCRGGQKWGNDLWNCVENRRAMSNQECRDRCNADSCCAMYDRPDQDQSECCLFKSGSSGDGGGGRVCYKKNTRRRRLLSAPLDNQGFEADVAAPVSRRRLSIRHHSRRLLGESSCTGSSSVFAVTGNGFFSCWVAVAASICLVASAFGQRIVNPFTQDDTFAHGSSTPGLQDSKTEATVEA